MTTTQRPLAVVTGASSGIGLELAKLCAQDGFDLVIAADEPAIAQAAQELRSLGASVDAVQVDLAEESGVDTLLSVLRGRPVDALLANAGHGLGRSFLEQNFDEIRHVIDTNITGTVYLVHCVLRGMHARNQGRILLTGSIAGHMPGPFQAVYHASKAFVDSFAVALRNELKDSQITVTCLQPGPTDTDFFARADMLDTRMGMLEKDDPSGVAKAGFEAMMKGSGEVVTGWKNKAQVAMSGIMPSGTVAEMSRKLNEPQTAEE
jgi:short-subunit dehydrogenase